MAGGGPRWCPKCQRGELKRHCTISTRQRPCGWEKCTQCRTTFDPVNNLGYDREGEKITWPTHWPAGEATL